MLVFGCRPDEGVKVSTTMVNEIASIMESRFDEMNFSIKLPEVLNQIKGEDAKFEMVLSSTI